MHADGNAQTQTLAPSDQQYPAMTRTLPIALTLALLAGCGGSNLGFETTPTPASTPSPTATETQTPTPTRRLVAVPICLCGDETQCLCGPLPGATVGTMCSDPPDPREGYEHCPGDTQLSCYPCGDGFAATCADGLFYCAIVTPTPMPPQPTPITATCAPTLGAEACCAAHCEPCPTIRAGCFAHSCQDCIERPDCGSLVLVPTCRPSPNATPST